MRRTRQRSHVWETQIQSLQVGETLIKSMAQISDVIFPKIFVGRFGCDSATPRSYTRHTTSMAPFFASILGNIPIADLHQDLISASLGIALSGRIYL